MIPSAVLGALILGVPATLLAYWALYRQPRSIFWFAFALILVGLGYLGGTGALSDIANTVTGEAGLTVAPGEPSIIEP
jgi:hypothetical protein